MHGTIWHDWFHATLESNGVRHENEVDLTEWMPDGWAGTADWIFWHPDYEAWVLGDLKTTKGEAMYWLQRGGAKDIHIWQLSAYWHALVASGRPMVKGFGVMYWPMNDTSDNVEVTPFVADCDPIPEDVILPVMQQRWRQTTSYITAYEATKDYLNIALCPEQERVQKLIWNKQQGVWDVKLVPHWSAAFCDFPDYCDCSKQGTTKIGHWWVYPDDAPIEYVYRDGYQDIEPTEKPTQFEINKRR